LRLSVKLIALLVPLFVLAILSRAGAQTGWLSGQSLSQPTATATVFLAFHENPSIALISVEANAQTVAPFAFTAKNLFCSWNNAAQGTGLTFVLRDNGAVTALTFTATSGTSGNDTTHSVSVSAGDLLDIGLVNSNTSNATGIWRCSISTQ